MRNASTAERILSRVTTPERAAAIVGDLAEEARTRGTLWFWFHVFRTALSHFSFMTRLSEEQRLGLIFGLISGGMWMGLLILVNLVGTSVPGNVRENHPRIYGYGFLMPAIIGLSAAYRMGGGMRAALRVGLISALISGVMCLSTMVPMTILFHDAMMLDPSNIHEFARARDMLWIGPLLGLTIGTLGAFFGKAMFLRDRKRAAAH